jgi:ComF family protein
MLFPTRCASCGAIGPAPCAVCIADLRPAPTLPPPPGLDVCIALVDYDGAGRDLVTGLKFRNARSVLAWLVRVLASLVRRHGVDVDVVTWAPTSAHRRRNRGYDQAELLARGVARRLRLPCRRLLTRRAGAPQTSLPLAQRRRGPTFVLRTARVPSRVLLVDDVVTSGSTLSSAARTLRAGGATHVVGLAVARTPLKRDRRAVDSVGDVLTNVGPAGPTTGGTGSGPGPPGPAQHVPD